MIDFRLQFISEGSADRVPILLGDELLGNKSKGLLYNECKSRHLVIDVILGNMMVSVPYVHSHY